MYKIEKGIKIPSWSPIKEHIAKFPFSDMKPGDSFLIPFKIENFKDLSPDEKKKVIVLRGRISYCFQMHKKIHGLTKKDFKLSTRIMPDGIRCWRVK